MGAGRSNRGKRSRPPSRVFETALSWDALPLSVLIVLTGISIRFPIVVRNIVR
jgi:hypothetical protein